MNKNNKIIEYLKQLDLSEIEAELYLILLNKGPVSVRDLAEISGIKRTTAYIYIDQLIDKGLVLKMVRESKKLVAANQPESSLKFLIEQKLQIANSTQKALPEILTIINNTPHAKNINDAEIKYLKGINSIRSIYEEAFKGNEIRSYVKVEEKADLSPDNADLFHKALNKNKKLKIWEIVYESPFSRRQAMRILSQSKSYFHKFMPSDLNWSITSEDIVMYDGKVAIIDYKGRVGAVVLQSNDFYHNSTQIFDFIWRILPEPGL